MGCHVTCELRYRRVSFVLPPAPCPVSPGRGFRTQPCSQGAWGFPHSVPAGPREAVCAPCMRGPLTQEAGPRDQGGGRGSCGKGDGEPSVHVSRGTWMESGLWG